LCALSSRHEAQCLAVLEAAACGVPTVGTAVGVIPELSRRGGAESVPVRDPRALGTAIARALSDSSNLAGRSSDASNAVIQDYGLTRSADAFRQLYASLRGSPRAS
jgi:glycosyltransferase involved in cell wall biosynthesis